MNEQDHITSRKPDAETAGVSSLLDALGRAEAAGAPAGLEAAIFAASRTRLAATPSDVAAMADDVDTLARREALRGPADLEQQAFELSREAVTSGRFVQSEPETPRPMRIHEVGHGRSSRFAWLGVMIRVAAGLLLLVGASVVVSHMWPATPQMAVNPQPEPTAAELASRIGTEMDALFEAMTLDGSRDDVSMDTTREADWDANWVDELFSQESL